jgi:hypothetical protein
VAATLALGILPLAVLTWELPGSGTTVFMILVLVAVLAEMLIATFGIAGFRRRALPWLILTLVTFGVASVIWRLSWTGGPLCDAATLLQGHALWHLLAEAVVPVLLFAHLAMTELPRTTQGA